ncbi:MAG: sensor histidine kinase [Candidatus Zipacnadales bacterium]
MLRQGRATIGWGIGTTILWASTTTLHYFDFAGAEIFYLVAIVAAALFVSPSYAAGLGLASILGVSVKPSTGIAKPVAFGLAAGATWLLAAYVARQRRAEHEDFEQILTLVRQVSSRLDATEVPTAIVRTAREATGAKASSLRLLAPDGRMLEVRAAEGLSRAYMEKGPVDVRRNPIDRKVLAGEIIQVRDVRTDPRILYRQEAQEEGIASLLCVPLRRKDQAVGVLRVYSARPRHFSDRDVRMLVALADHAVIALRHAELHQAALKFMRKVSHELKAPLAAIGSYVKILLEGITGSLTPQQEEMLRRVDRRCTLLIQSVNDLLALSRVRLEKPADAMTEVRLSTILESVVALQAPRAEEAGITLSFHHDPDLPLVTGNPDEIEELAGNLISNAIKYTPRGGQVVVETVCNGQCALVRVADTGIGIPAEDLPRLFEEFHRCANARASEIEGTGLGMAIVKTIADRHGATISVESKEGQGTTVQVAFPLTAPHKLPAGGSTDG